MRLHFRKTIGRYKKGSIHEVRDSLARVYLRANIANQSYEQKVIAEPLAKAELHPCPVLDATTVDELSLARAEYQDKFGKRAFHGWSLDVLKSKIAEAE